MFVCSSICKQEIELRIDCLKWWILNFMKCQTNHMYFFDYVDAPILRDLCTHVHCTYIIHVHVLINLVMYMYISICKVFSQCNITDKLSYFIFIEKKLWKCYKMFLQNWILMQECFLVEDSGIRIERFIWLQQPTGDRIHEIELIWEYLITKKWYMWAEHACSLNFSFRTCPIGDTSIFTSWYIVCNLKLHV